MVSPMQAKEASLPTPYIHLGTYAAEFGDASDLLMNVGTDVNNASTSTDVSTGRNEVSNNVEQSDSHQKFLTYARNALHCTPHEPPPGEDLQYEKNDDFRLATVREYYLAREQSPFPSNEIRDPKPLYPNPKNNSGQCLRNGVDMVLSVSFYHRSTGKKHMQASVFGRQPLTALRDIVVCDADKRKDSMPGKSAYFFIEGTFYNDMRKVEAIDYSANVIAWIEENDTRMQKYGDRNGNVHSRTMENTTFSDITVRLGVSYVFVHQGSCEHMVKFEAVHIYDPSVDFRFESNYPVLTFLHIGQPQKCNVCGLFVAKQVTYDNNLVPNNPTFFCEYCFDPLHHGEDGNLLSAAGPDFQVYPYP
eukprot:CFRG0599T1